MKRTILAFLIILVISFQVFASETVRVYDSKYQLKYIYDVESGRVYDTRYQLRYTVENNRVYDSNYQPIYTYDPDKGTIYDYGYNLQYRIEGNTVYDTQYYPIQTEAWFGGSTWIKRGKVLSFDAFGNALITQDPRGYKTYYFYGDNTNNCSNDTSNLGHAFLTCTINALGHRSEQNFDPRLGVPTSFTDINGAVTHFGYDSFGRQVAVWRSGDRLRRR